MKNFEGLTLDEERALYGIADAMVKNCRFSGPLDGESALKECTNVSISDCSFDLRYPMWHLQSSRIKNSTMSETCRAALWYDREICISHSKLHGIKALRECSDVLIKDCDINSLEFGWFCDRVKIKDTKLISEYPFMKTRNLEIMNFEMKGKYSFQYVENVLIKDSYLDTKDAFWHGKNITVQDSVVKGEYLGWYSENLKFVRCKIIGTQPLCYAQNLVLEDCEMIDTDLSFEYSDVRADVKGSILSVKNPKSGYICADSIGEIILDEHKIKNSSCEITDRNFEKVS